MPSPSLPQREGDSGAASGLRAGQRMTPLPKIPHPAGQDKDWLTSLHA